MIIYNAAIQGNLDAAQDSKPSSIAVIFKYKGTLQILINQPMKGRLHISIQAKAHSLVNQYMEDPHTTIRVQISQSKVESAYQ